MAKKDKQITFRLKDKSLEQKFKTIRFLLRITGQEVCERALLTYYDKLRGENPHFLEMEEIWET